MKRLTSLGIALLVPAIALADIAEKTISVPRRDQTVKINFSSEGATIESVRIQNYPDSEAVEKAKAKDQKDKSFVFWNFSVSNPSARKVKIKIDVTLVGKDGQEVGHNDKSDTVDAGRTDDNIRVMMHPRILDLVNAKSARLRLSIEPK